MVKIAVLGSTGMLGNAVSKHFINIGYEVITTYRNEKVSFGENREYYDPSLSGVEMSFDCDYVINCIGIIKPFVDNDKQKTIYLNSLFPRELADYCKETNRKLIHITTDCVFSGEDGNYDEDSDHDCIDFYGKSKSLGEPENCMVIRTSIVGEEIHNNASLISWVKSRKGKDANGYTNHFWNGVTTKQYANICQDIIEENLYTDGLYHLCSNKVSKYELVKCINKRFDLGIDITPINTDIPINRTMNTNTKLGLKLSNKLQSVEEQIFNL